MFISENNLKRYKIPFALFLVLCVLMVFTRYPALIEKYYSTGIYLSISQFFRLLFGWIPFSLGDIVYVIVIILIIAKVVLFLVTYKKRNTIKSCRPLVLRNVATGALSIYIVFNVLWGFNYYRLGSAYQLGIQPAEYNSVDLQRLTDTLVSRLKKLSPKITYADSSVWNSYPNLKESSIAAYRQLAVHYPFLKYTNPSIKKMLIASAGGYGGYSGYINPFTGEAQVDNNLPGFAKPSVMCHEMAHQIGYAAEEEANLIGYLACIHSANNAVQYSAYHGMFLYATNELYHVDSSAYLQYKTSLPPLVFAHTNQLQTYYHRFKNPAQPIINWWYDKYLRANNQQKGLQSYSYVTAWLIAYAKAKGWEKL